MQISISEFEGCGISLEGCQNVTISNNQISLSDIAISRWSASHNNISLNTLHNNIGGILLSPYSDYNTVSENTITQEDSSGTSVEDGSFNRISQNDVKRVKDCAGYVLLRVGRRIIIYQKNLVVHSKIDMSGEGVKKTRVYKK